MKSDNQVFSIRIPSVESYIKDDSLICLEEQYSVLKNARREVNEITEIAAALGEGYVANFVTFSPRRLSFFETIVSIQTEVKLRDDSDLSSISLQVYNDHIVSLLKSRDSYSGEKIEDKILQEIEQDILSKIDLAYADFKALALNERTIIDQANLSEDHQVFVAAIKEVYNKIKRRIDDGSYIPGEFSFDNNHESITKKIVFDRFYNKIMPVKIREIVNPVILDLLQERSIFYPSRNGAKNIPLKRLSSHQDADRHTFMMAGAPASGKGTAFGMVTVDANILGIESIELLKSDTDSYRHLVSHEKELGPNKVNHSSLNFDESYLISRMVYTRVNEKLQNSKSGPHMLIDTVYPAQDKINLSTANQGKLHIYCVSVPVEISLQRAFSRGKSTGRYVDAALILKAHRDISKNFFYILSSQNNHNIDYVLLDNNVPSGEFATLVAEGNLNDKVIVIHDAAKFLEFLNKSNLNLSSTIKENLYLTTKRKLPIDFLNDLDGLGFKIEFKEPFAARIFKVFNPERSLKSSIRNALEDRPSLSVGTSSSVSNSLNFSSKKNKKAGIIKR